MWARNSFIQRFFCLAFPLVSTCFLSSGNVLNEKEKLRKDIVALSSLRERDLEKFRNLRKNFDLFVNYFPELKNSDISQTLLENRILLNERREISVKIKEISSELKKENLREKNSSLEKIVRELDSLDRNYNLSSPESLHYNLRDLRILSINEEGSLLILEGGKNQGVRAGMTFFSLEAGGKEAEIIIVDVVDDYSVAFLLKDKYLGKMKVGKRVKLKIF